MSWWVWKNALRDTELEIEEADVLKVPAKVYTPSPEEYNKTLRDPPALQELVPDLKAK